MMKFVLVLALVAAAMAGAPTCTTLENADWEDPNTIVPWLTNSYMGGSMACRNAVQAERCELLQQNAVDFNNNGQLTNAGRISVGQLQRPAACRTEGQVGMNVWQQNIGMCRGVSMSVQVGVQDRSNNPNSDRVPDFFAMIVGRDNFDIMGGTHTEVATHTFPVPAGRPFNTFRATKIEGTWNGPVGDDCSQICPDTNCYAVGVRYAKNAIVTSRVRGYIDDLTITDEVKPVITANDVSAMAASCSASTFVNFDTTATDNCCAAVTIEYQWGTGDYSTTASGSFTPGSTTVNVRATDNSGNVETATFVVRIAEFKPDISCSDYRTTTQSCWTAVPDGEQDRATKVGACDTSSEITYNPEMTSMFRNGVTVVEATYTQPDELGGTYTMQCSFEVQFTLCCEANYSNGDKRSAAPLRKLAKF